MNAEHQTTEILYKQTDSGEFQFTRVTRLTWTVSPADLHAAFKRIDAEFPTALVRYEASGGTPKPSPSTTAAVSTAGVLTRPVDSAGKPRSAREYICELRKNPPDAWLTADQLAEILVGMGWESESDRRGGTVSRQLKALIDSDDGGWVKHRRSGGAGPGKKPYEYKLLGVANETRALTPEDVSKPRSFPVASLGAATEEDAKTDLMRD